MKTIKILTLKIENFKCHDCLTLSFGGRNAAIYGDNGAGKTSVYDALTWLLFGHDSRGNGEKVAEVKPLSSSGEVRSHDAVTAVEAVLDVDGQEIALRREYREVWTSRRGELCYDGNVSAYTIQGVPVKYTAFREKIDEIVEEDLFRLLTDVHYFAGELPWQKRREILVKVAHLPEDRQILETGFAHLLAGMGQLDLEAYRKKLLAEKKGLVGARNELPARIDECKKTVADLEHLDFTAARAMLADARQQKAALPQEPDDLEALEAENRTYLAKREALRGEISRAQERVRRSARQRDAMASTLAGIQKRLEENRRCQASERGLVSICPTCGQPLTGERMVAFDRHRQENLWALEQEADRLTTEQQSISLPEAEEACRAEEAQLAALQMQLSAMGMELPGYAQRRAALENGRKTSETARRQRQLDAQIAESMALLAKEDTLRYARGRVAALHKDAQQAEQKLQETERMLALIEQFTRYRAHLLEQSVNDAFRLASFRLFREQVSGGLEERCDVVYQGVPYPGLNAGAKINVGIDILNTLGRVYGVRVPLFIDNAESVTRLEEGQMQVIRLVVSAGESLRLEAAVPPDNTCSAGL